MMVSTGGHFACRPPATEGYGTLSTTRRYTAS